MILDLPSWARCCVVTGPQRSGTTIAATMLAHDWGWGLMREERFGTNDESLFLKRWRSADRVVIQAPGMAHLVTTYGTADTLVVWMRRPMREILRSQQRINWGKYEAIERAKFGDESDRPMCQVKLLHWRRVRMQVALWRELHYESLRDHPLYVPRAKRKRFHARQTA